MARLGPIARWLGRGAAKPASQPQPKTPPAPAASRPATPATTPATAPGKPPPRTVVAVTVLGLDGEALEQVAGLIERQCAEQNLQAICITDQSDFAPFRRRRLIVDQVVDAERRVMEMPELSWRLYRHAQFVLLGKRWRPTTVISFGRPPEADCLAALERSRG
jgi:hypothetical protein